MTGITYPSGRILAITRNSVGQVTGVTMKKNATAAVESVASALAFQPLSDQLATLTHGNGLVSNAVYDLDGRLTQLQVKNGTTLVSGFGLAYADNLNLTGITDQVTAANSNVLSYTPANRLASASGAWGNKAYSYDGVGNRITDVTTGGSTVSRTQYYSNTSNRLNDIWENGAQLRVYTYDGAGNTLTETRPGEAFAYAYNKRNRLASVTRNGSLWGTYVYNAFEQLVSRTSPAPAAPLGTVHYIHDLDGHLIAEADGATGTTLRDYIWLPANDNEVQDLPLAVIDGVNTATPATSFIHTDHLGRPTRMTNAAKATVWQAVWTPWGEAQSMTGSVTNNLRFPGQYFQIETGLAYNHHRTYDPVTGRYTQPDPLGFVDGPSVYAYAGNSPWMNVDRSGLESVLIVKTQSNPNYEDTDTGGQPWEDWAKTAVNVCKCPGADITIVNSYDTGDFDTLLSRHQDISKIIIIGHSSSQGIYFGSRAIPGANMSLIPGENNESPYKFNWRNLRKGAQIFLWGCNAGQGKNSIAQDIANASGATVNAFSGTVVLDKKSGPYVRWYKPGGPVTIKPTGTK